MADELDVALTEPSEADKRIKQLSGKVKESSEALETANAAKVEAERKAAEAERKASFSDGFADIVAENPAAKEFKAQLEEKVLGGMSLEDAKYIVLGKAGKLASQESHESPAGGSAATSVTIPVQKSNGDMSQEERLNALKEAEKKGDLSWSQ